MISISQQTASTAGSVILRNWTESGGYANTARIGREKLLDGTTAYIHSGVSDGDRDLSISCRVSEAEKAILKSIFENQTMILISFWEGFFTGYAYSLDIQRNGIAKLTIYIKEQIA